MLQQKKSQINTPGSLYIVATPMGNRQDITLRAIETLKTVDLIAAEDTRHSIQLLQHLGISKPILALHEHNEREQVDKFILRLIEGESIALISDAGTPLISDPGYHFVRIARERGIKIIPIPGPCAAIAALSVAGLPTDRFIFEGFLPTKSSARQERLRMYHEETRTLVFYESPHRILNLLLDMVTVLGEDRIVVIARELTKLFETIHQGTLSSVIDWMENDINQQKGEFVVILAGKEKTEDTEKNILLDDTLLLLLEELSIKKAAELAAKLTGKRKNEVYQRALQLKKTSE